jgi:hypothetical protein
LPYFLRDALDMLHKQRESLEHMESCLEALPTLIGRHPADLPSLARELMGALLSLGSNVFVESQPRLARWRLEAMVALCCTTPRVGTGSAGASSTAALSETVAYLIGQFWSANYALGTKIEMLDVLRQAAERLAGFQEDKSSKTGTAQQAQPLIQEVSSAATAGRSLVPVNTPVYASSSSGSSSLSTLAQAQALIAARVESRTRRWGSTKPSAGSPAVPPTYSVNRFAGVAHLFFFPLMRLIDSPAHAAQLTAHDGLVLLRLLATVSSFLPASSGLAQALPLITRNMAATLMEFLLVSSSARGLAATASSGGSSGAGSGGGQVGLRRMVFFCLSRILVVYSSSSLFLADFSREVAELVGWLTESASRDPDHECRQLAAANLALMRELVPANPFEALFKNEQNNVAAQVSIANAALPKLRL